MGTARRKGPLPGKGVIAMAFLRQIFRPGQDEFWKQFADEIGAEFVAGGFWRTSKVIARVKAWPMTLDTYTVSDRYSSTTYTRMRAPFVSRDGFRFTVYRQGFFSELGKLLGMQDIEVGDPDFDRAFIVKGNDPTKVALFFANQQIRQLIQFQPSPFFQISDNEGWFGVAFPEGVDELYFRTTGVIKDVAQLKSIYELFAETLNQLCAIGSADTSDPQLVL
jgi:hypothetical protein